MNTNQTTNEALLVELGSLLARIEAAKWISVNERLPPTQRRESNGWLVTNHSELMLVVVDGKTERYPHYCDDRGQWRPVGMEFHGHYAQVSHWQEYPAPAPVIPVTED